MAIVTDSSTPPVAPAAPLAVDTANIGPRLRRQRAIGAVFVFVIVFAFVGNILGWAYLDHRYRARQQLLDHTSGQIRAVHEDGGDSRAGDVDLRYLWSGAVRRTSVGVHDAGAWYVGEEVMVLVDPERSFVTLPGENYKPDWVDGVALLLGFGLFFVFFGAVGVWGDAHQKLRRARGSSWRTVDALFVQPAGENNEKTVVYLPEYATDRLWTVHDRLPAPSVRCQIAGARNGLVLRRAEDAKIVCAEPIALGPARTACVAAHQWRDGNLGLRLEAGDDPVFVSVDGNRIPTDVGDPTMVRAATVRFGSNGEAVLHLGVSRTPTYARRIVTKRLGKQWPDLVAGR